MKANSLSAVSADLSHEIVELLDAPGAERNGEAAGGELDCGGFSDSGGSAGHDRWSALGKGCKTWHWAQAFRADLSADLEGHGQVSESADIARVDADGVGLVDLEAADSLEQLGKCHP